MWSRLTNPHSISLLDVLALAESIRNLTLAAKRSRTSLWSALQVTVLFSLDPELAAGEATLTDESLLDEFDPNQFQDPTINDEEEEKEEESEPVDEESQETEGKD